jgi:hypothetical protein
MTVHGLLQKSRLDAERLPYRIKPIRGGWYRIIRPCPTGETHIKWCSTMEDAETFLVRKLSVEA